MGVSFELLLPLLLQFFIAEGFESGCDWSGLLLSLLDPELDPVKIQLTTILRILISNKDFCWCLPRYVGTNYLLQVSLLEIKRKKCKTPIFLYLNCCEVKCWNRIWIRIATNAYPKHTALERLAIHNYKANYTNFKNSKLSRHSGVSQTWSHSSSPTTASGKSISEACEPYMATLFYLFELYLAHARRSSNNDRNAAYSKRIDSVAVPLLSRFLTF